MKVVKVYLRTLRILWHEEKLLTLGLVFTAVLVGGIQILEPLLFGQVIDSLSKQAGVFHLLSIWAIIGVANIFFSVFLGVMSDRLAHRQRLNMLDGVFERVITLPMSYHSEQGSGRVVRSILSGTDQLFNLWLSFMREHLASFIGIAFLVPTAMGMDWRMALMLFGLASVYLVGNFWIVKRTHTLQEKIEEDQQSLFSRIGDVIGNVMVVQSYTRLMDEMKALQQITARLLSAQYPVLTWWGILSVITRISATLTIVSVLALGSWLAEQGQLTVGEVVAFAGFSGLLITKLEQVSGFLSRVISQAPSLQNFFSLLDHEGAAPEAPNAKPLQVSRGEVVFDRVTYQYQDGPRGVFNLNFTVKPGQTIALVGPSGSGKTTTLALMQRLFDPQQGRITIDGEDIRHCTLTSLRNSIATVFQDSGLFNRSISENIRVGRPAATDAEVEAAAKQADAHEFIMQKQGGYDFVIGERGAALSGGERQRIAIARAILKDAPILILDEATSALDNATEKRIQEAIYNLKVSQKTTFIIAHRLSTVTKADFILVFQNGKVIESGTFENLKRSNGLFAELLKLGEFFREAR